MKRLHGRVAVVTGAAGGIGRAVAVELARRGCDVALVDVREAELAETARRVQAEGRKASTWLVDVADRAAMAALPERVIAEHGHVHVLVNNAGVALDASFEAASLEDLDWIIGINLWGVIHGCKFFLPWMRREEEAHVVNISSLFGIIGVPQNSAYCATKFAVRGLSESMWTELSRDGVGVTSVHPGGIRTDIVRSARHAGDVDATEMIATFDRMARTSPEAAARKIVRGIERGAPRVRITAETFVFDVLKRLFPNATQRLIRLGASRVPQASPADPS